MNASIPPCLLSTKARVAVNLAALRLKRARASQQEADKIIPPLHKSSPWTKISDMGYDAEAIHDEV